ncbi:multidrug transporter MATE [Prevotella pallens]|uniref:multidrug transporter MATE n=2 Tax=Prevotella pallens TaxID=60133 RepID=UPI0028DCA794|nr:multidrug transporter MATE [Prevotella pallens]
MGGGLLCRLLGYQSIINKPFIWSYIIIFAIFEFLVFFWKNRYLEIFGEYAKQIGTPAMKRKMKNAKIFNYSIFILDVILLFIVDYLNHHGG